MGWSAGPSLNDITCRDDYDKIAEAMFTCFLTFQRLVGLPFVYGGYIWNLVSKWFEYILDVLPSSDTKSLEELREL